MLRGVQAGLDLYVLILFGPLLGLIPRCLRELALSECRSGVVRRRGGRGLCVLLSSKGFVPVDQCRGSRGLCGGLGILRSRLRRKGISTVGGGRVNDPVNICLQPRRGLYENRSPQIVRQREDAV